MENPLISVIVPCYNVEKYVAECLKSIVEQSYEHLEIIVVNDGSTDNTDREILPFLEDKRVRYIVQENQGLSGARNTGLDNMKGEYVCFVDSDDFIHPDFVKTLYQNLAENEADIAICDYYEFEEGEAYHFEEIKNKEKSIFNREGIMQEMLNNGRVCIAWNKLYKSTIFANLRFQLGRIHEDEFIVHHIFWRIKKVAKIMDQLYFYRRVAGSITTSSYTDKKIKDFIEAMNDRIRFLKINNIPNIEKVYHLKWMVIVNRGIRGHKLGYAKKYLIYRPIEFISKMPQSKIKNIKFYLRVFKDIIFKKTNS